MNSITLTFSETNIYKLFGAGLFSITILVALCASPFIADLFAESVPLSSRTEEPLTGIVQVVAGSSHTCALTNSGAVKCWGSNSSGQLGDGSKTQNSSPVDVAGLDSRVTAIVAGASHTCALTDASGVKCWGSNSYGQLGDGTSADKSRPVDVVGLQSGVKAISSRWLHTCALTNEGVVKCWGANYKGQLGNGESGDRSRPVAVEGLDMAVSSVATGGRFTCVLTIDSLAKCWGDNEEGQLGDGSTDDSYIPVAVIGLGSGVVALTAGSDHACALTSSGGLKCWGNAEHGQLGNNTTVSSSTPVDVTGFGNTVTSVAAGINHNCALMGDVLKCWGNNKNGQLGDGTITDSRSAPTDVVGASAKVAAVAVGAAHTCLLTNAGSVKCWGDNRKGQIGDYRKSWSTDPVSAVGLPDNIDFIDAGWGYTCTLDSGGRVRCWGSNGSGKLGDGTNSNRNRPVDVLGLEDGVTAINAGWIHTCALTSTGGVKCWGGEYFRPTG